MRKILPTILLVLLLTCGLGLLLYPSVSNWWNEMHSSRSVASYQDAISTIDPELKAKYWADAKEYNDSLIGNPSRLKIRDDLSAMELYNSILDFDTGGMMGYVSIPSIEVSIPIYHGTEDNVLQVAVGHLEGTSMPIGGPGTHVALSGHTGLPSAELFTHLTDVVVGDTFILYILDEKMTYQVDQILVVLPTEMESLAIDKDKDECTLITCTPYGVNTHRLLVRGHRIANADEAGTIKAPDADATKLDTAFTAIIIMAPAMLIYILVAGRGGKKAKKKKGKPKNKEESA